MKYSELLYGERICTFGLNDAPDFIRSTSNREPMVSNKVIKMHAVICH